MKGASQVAQWVKNLPAMQTQETWVHNPGLGRSPGGGHSYPLQYSCLENPIDRGTSRAAVHKSQRVGHDWKDWACMDKHKVLPIFRHLVKNHRNWLSITEHLQTGYNLFSTIDISIKLKILSLNAKAFWFYLFSKILSTFLFQHNWLPFIFKAGKSISWNINLKTWAVCYWQVSFHRFILNKFWLHTFIISKIW